MDKATSSYERLEYTCCFVEISAKTPVTKFVHQEIEDGEKVNVDIEYEWLPPRCSKCICFGHVDHQCPTKQLWKQKKIVHAGPHDN